MIRAGSISPRAFAGPFGVPIEIQPSSLSTTGGARGKTGEVLEAERVRAMQAPVVVAVIARIATGNSDVPPY